MSHTKEPWAVDSVMSEAMHDIILDYHAPDGGYPTVVAMAHGYKDEFPSVLEAEANARRIVACVNACAGIENPAAIPELIELAMESLCAIVQKADDSDPYNWGVGLAIALRECIAKLKAGA